MFAASLGALLARSIDYAGIFPPCSLALEPALQNQALYIRDPDAWMLNNFVLPVEKFDAVVGCISLFDWKHPLRISALGGKSATKDEFLAALKIAADKIRSFSADHVEPFTPVTGLLLATRLTIVKPPLVRSRMLVDARSPSSPSIGREPGAAT